MLNEDVKCKMDTRMRPHHVTLAAFSLVQEMWNCPYSNDSFPSYAEEIDDGLSGSPSSMMMSSIAKEMKVTLIGGGTHISYTLLLDDVIYLPISRVLFCKTCTISCIIKTTYNTDSICILLFFPCFSMYTTFRDIDFGMVI